MKYLILTPIVFAALAGGAHAVGCSASSDPRPDGPSGGAGGLVLLGGDGGSGGITDACALFDEEATIKPVNLYIMFDKSSSMAGNKWDSAKDGLAAFVDDESSSGLRVGLRFFPRAPGGTACDQQAYKEPIVDFGVLPDNAAALKAGMAAEAPNGFGTPMYPALGGAILKGIELASAEPDTRSAVLLVTDGLSEGPANDCSGVDPEDPASIAALAATGLAFKPSVTTYVVALPGADKAVADQIAAAGGSDEAIVVTSANVKEEFRLALLKVRGDTIPCEYELPQQVLDGEVGLGGVNLQITPGNGGEPFTVPFDPDCASDGWRYDDPDDPTAIVLCDVSCDGLRQDLEASLRLVLGCQTIPK